MLQSFHKHAHKHHILISIFTFIIITSLILLPVLSMPNQKQSKLKTPNEFTDLIINNPQSTSSSFVSIITNSISSESITSSILSSLSSIIETSRVETKIIEEVKPVFTKPIEPIPAQQVQPQNNLEKKPEPIYTPAPKPIVVEKAKPIPQTIVEPEPEPIIALAPVVETTKPNVDNSYISAGCDQSLANQMLNIVNNHRAANGAKQLSFSSQLTSIACAHSKWMTSSGIFSHTGRDNTNSFERCKKAGTYCYAENVAYNTIPDVQDLFDQLKNSPGHNINMIDPNFVEVGIAFDGIYVTQIFR